MRKYLPIPDRDDYDFRHNYGEFSEKKERAFNRKLKRLQRIANFARKKFPCLKGKEQQFLDYVLKEEPLWYGFCSLKDIK